MSALLAISPEPAPLATDADGVVRIAGTRVTLDTLVAAYREGASAETIAEQYPALEIGQVYSALGYYLRHQIEVDAYLVARGLVAQSVRAENESRSAKGGVRERLLPRRSAAP